MLVEIPNIKRCCCCLPLRRGILTFAYLNLFITIFFGVIQVLIWTYLSNKKRTYSVGMYRGVVMESQIFFVIMLHVLDIVFNIILIVGAHMKNCKLMRIYYYYQMTTMFASFLVLLVTYCYSSNSYWEAVVSELAVAFLGFVIQIYLLLLIHSELNKQRYQEGRSSFINQMSQVCVEPSVRIDRRNFL